MVGFDLLLIFQYLDDFNLGSAKEMKLVFFLDAVQHVTRYTHSDG